MSKRRLLLINSVLMSVYLFGSIPYYLIANDQNQRFVIFSAIYTVLVLIHGIIIGFAVLFQWIGYIKKSRGWISFSTFVMFIGAFAFIISYIVIIPMMIINSIAKEKRKKV